MSKVFNESGIIDIRKNFENSMNDQIASMESTKSKFDAIASQLDAEASNMEQQASVQDNIAATAMKTIYYTNSDGDTRSKSVPDTVKRAAAAAAAASLRAAASAKRSQSAALKNAAQALSGGISDLTNFKDSSALFINNLLSEINNSDITHQQKMDSINQQIEQLNKQINNIKNSFNDNFNLNIDDLTILGSINGFDINPTDLLLAEQNRVLMALNGKPGECGLFGDPVNMSTGNFVYEDTDFFINGAIPLTIKRTYNSMFNKESLFGLGWINNYSVKLDFYNDEVCDMQFSDGRIETFVNKEKNLFISQTNTENKIEKHEDHYRYINKHVIYVFGLSGNLLFIEDSDNKKIDFIYEKDLLVKIKSVSGFFLFNYNEKKHVQSIEDHTGRKNKYFYSKNLLEKVVFSNESEINYTYNRDNVLESIVNSIDNTVLKNEYNDDNKTIKQNFPDNTTINMKYDNVKTTATSRNGNITEYIRDDKYRTIQINYSDGSEEFAYDENNNRTMYTDKNNNTYKYKYKNNNLYKITDPTGKKTRFEYNQQNKIIQKHDNHGVSYSYFYDDNGNLTGAIDPIDRTIKLSYINGLVNKIIFPDGSFEEIKYDDKNNVSVVNDRHNVTRSYSYDSLNRVTKRLNDNGIFEKYEYDNRDQLIEVTNALGYTKKFSYNASGYMEKTIDFDEQSTLFSYNKIGKPEQITDKNGNTIIIEYNSDWLIEKIIDAEENKFLYEYDDSCRLKKIIDPLKNNKRFSYDPNGNIINTKHGDDNLTEYEYDSLNRLIKTTLANGLTTEYLYDNMDNMVEKKSSNGQKESYKFNFASQLIEKIDSLDRCTCYEYDLLGNIEKIIFDNNIVEENEYYSGGKIKKKIVSNGDISEFFYNNLGLLIKIIVNGISTNYIYDKLNRVTSIVDAAGHSKTMQYNPSNLLELYIDQNSNEYTYEYDFNGNLVKITDPKGIETKYAYNKTNKMEKIEQLNFIDDNLHLTQEKIVTEYNYDALGRVVEIINPDGLSLRYEYDSAGNIISKIDEDGHTTNYAYDLLNNITNIVYHDDCQVNFKYNNLQKIGEARDWNGTKHFSCDIMGRLTSATGYNGDRIEYEWDANDNYKSITYPDNSIVLYNYNSKNKLESVVSNNQITKYDYNTLGRLEKETKPNDISTNYEYNDLGLLSRLSSTIFDEIVDRYSYEYDPLGNIAEINKFRRDVDDENGTFSYKYDELNRLIESNYNDVNTLYHYDNLGNRTCKNINGDITNYQFNNLNQLISVQNNGDITTYKYDNRGNLAEKHIDNIITKYEFNSMNMLQNITTPTDTIDFLYDSFSNRISETHNKESRTDFTHNILKPYNNILQTKDQNEPTNYVWGNELISSKGKINSFYMFDHLGSNIREIDDNSKISTQSFDEFGIPDPNNSSKFQYTGYYKNDYDDLYYANARFYSPENARFISKDINKGYIAAPYSLNNYSYVFNNPLVFVDRDGKWPWLFGTEEISEIDYINNPADGLIGIYVESGTETITKESNAIFKQTNVTTLSGGVPGHRTEFSINIFGISVIIDGSLSNGEIGIGAEVDWKYVNVDARANIGTEDWVGVDATAKVGNGEHMVGLEAGVGINPWSQVTLGGVYEKDDGTTTGRNAAGVNINSGAIEVVLAAVFAPYLLPELAPAFEKGFAAIGMTGVLAVNNINAQTGTACVK